jgi:1-acyl-sn-glycerol-3-phosphate acyltransferase
VPPTRENAMTRRFARLFLRATGWQPEGQRPAARRYVLIAAPHTSNWDLAYLLALATVFDVRVSWMGKQQLFRGPMGRVMRRLGGVPVRRDRRNDLVRQMADVIEASDSIALVVPAEGTRSYVPHWKSGFYHIARTAGVPIVMGYLDFARKRGGFGPELIPTGDVGQDMDEIRSFYSDKTGRFPDQFGEIRLKEET